MPDEPLVPVLIYTKSIPVIAEIQRTLDRTSDEDIRELIHEALRVYMMAVTKGKEGCDIGAYDREKGIFTRYAIWPFLG